MDSQYIEIIKLCGPIVSIASAVGRFETIRGPVIGRIRSLLNSVKDECGLAMLEEIIDPRCMPYKEIQIEFERILAICLKEDEDDAKFFSDSINNYRSELESSVDLERNLLEKGRKLNDLSDCYLFQNRHDDAIKMLKQSLEIFKNINDNEMEGITLLKRGNIYNIINKDDSAIRCYNLALAKLKEFARGPYYISAINNNIGNILFRKGMLDEAGKKFSDAIQSNHKSLQCEAFLNLGNVYRNREDFEKAITAYNECIDNTKNITPHVTSLLINKMALIGIANCYIEMKSPDMFLEAARSYGKSYRIMKILKYKKGMCIALMNIGTVFYKKDKFEKALKFYKMALEKNIEITDSIIKCTIQMNIGNVLRSQNKRNDAIRCYKNALSEFEEFEKSSELKLVDLEFGGENKFTTSMPMLKSQLLGNIANAYLDEGMFDDAIDRFNDALKVEGKIGKFDNILMMRLGLAHFNKQENGEASYYWEKAASNLAHEDNFKEEYELVTGWLRKTKI